MSAYAHLAVRRSAGPRLYCLALCPLGMRSPPVFLRIQEGRRQACGNRLPYIPGLGRRLPCASAACPQSISGRTRRDVVSSDVASDSDTGAGERAGNGTGAIAPAQAMSQGAIVTVRTSPIEPQPED